MLQSFSLSNFKSYGRAVLPLGTLTLLVGQNASGKSNALEALRILSWLARGRHFADIEAHLREENALVRGDVRDFFLNADEPIVLEASLDHGRRTPAPGSGEPPESSVLVELGVDLREGRMSVCRETLSRGPERPLYSATRPETEPSAGYLDIDYGGPSDESWHARWDDVSPLFYQIRSPGQFPGRADDPTSASIHNATRLVRETLAKTRFLDPVPSRMRGYVAAGADELREDGSNLSAVLHRLVADDDRKASLLGFIGSLPEQRITDIDFIETSRGDVMVRLQESFGRRERWTDAPLLSDGTLRVLAIGAALSSGEPGTTWVIEEIDSGIHPSRAEALMRRVRRTAVDQHLRIILTSHNPALLDALEDEALADVVCCFRDEESGNSQLTRLGDLDRFAELAASGPLGELATRRALERFVKDDTTPEERKRQALDWIEALRTGTDPA